MLANENVSNDDNLLGNNHDHEKHYRREISG